METVILVAYLTIITIAILLILWTLKDIQRVSEEILKALSTVPEETKSIPVAIRKLGEAQNRGDLMEKFQTSTDRLWEEDNLEAEEIEELYGKG